MINHSETRASKEVTEEQSTDKMQPHNKVVNKYYNHKMGLSLAKASKPKITIRTETK